MYGALWRALPGPWWVRLIILLILIAIVLVVLFTVVFPWVQTLIPVPDSTIEE
ncbi:MAG: hypothetical protein QM607_12335 [Microbacterium sp.]